MNLITCLEIANNYPDQMLITSAKDKEGMHAGFLYRLKGSDVHKILCSTEHVFDTQEEAEKCLHDVCKEACAYIKNFKPELHKQLTNPTPPPL